MFSRQNSNPNPQKSNDFYGGKEYGIWAISQAISGDIKDDTPNKTTTGNSLLKELLNNKNKVAYT